MTNDIKCITERVRAEIPDVDVVQMQKTHPGDDDGLWWFRRPGKTKDIQIESSSHSLPFIIEHDDMRSSSDALSGTTIDEVVQHVVTYLKRLA